MSPIGRIVNTIPSHDTVLRRVVDRIAGELKPETPAQLAAHLRPLYPRVAVFERQLSGEPRQVYVYRDGRYEPEPMDGWWRSRTVPRARISLPKGGLVRASESFGRLLGVASSELVGRSFLDLVRADARHVAAAMVDALGHEEEAWSEVMLVRPDASTVLLEMRGVRRDGGVDLCFRPVAASGPS